MSPAPPNNLSTGTDTSLIHAAPAGSLTYWDRINQARWGAYLIRRERQFVLEAQALAGQPGAAIDLGCGSGQWSRMLSDLGWNVTSIDIDSQSLAICHRNAPSVRIIQSKPEATTIPCSTGSASLLVCIEVAPVVLASWFLPECNRVLAKGGFAVAVWWNRRSWRWLGWMIKQRLGGNADGQTFYKKSYPAWRSELQAAGFSVALEEGFSWGPFSRASNSPLIPAFTGLERLLQLRRFVGLSPWVLIAARKDRP